MTRREFLERWRRAKEVQPLVRAEIEARLAELRKARETSQEFPRPQGGRMNDHLATDLRAFLDEHNRCGELDTGMVGTPPRVWLTCSCGARLERPADDDHAEGDR